jgi:hypothetical protein
MKDQQKTANHRGRRTANVKIGNTAARLKEISAAIAKRAYEIYERQGRRSGCDRENWLLAEREILQPLCCGVLESEDRIIISLFCSALGTDEVEEIELCIEPHRLIIAGKKGPSAVLDKDDRVYRVLPLAEEFDLSSVKLRQHGPQLEIEIRKSKVSKNSTVAERAA